MSTTTDHPPIKITDQDGIPFPGEVGVLPSQDLVLFPHMIAPLVLSDEAAKQLVDAALRKDRLIALFPSKVTVVPPAPASPEGGVLKSGEELESTTTIVPVATPAQASENLFHVGTLAVILRMLKIPDGSIRLLVHGVSRVSITGIVARYPFLVARIARIEEQAAEDMEVEALKKQTLESLQRAISLTNMPEDLHIAAMNVEDAGKLADLVASNVNLRPDQMREVLSESHTKKRLNLVYQMLSRELTVMEIGSRISEKVRESVDKNQRDYFLREQIRVMQGELGEQDPHEREMQELRERMAKKPMPDYARKVATRELDRLAVLQPAAAEYSVIRTYLDWILDLPWEEKTDDHIDLLRAHEVLDEDHYGLDKVKERILEFLSVIRLKGGNLKGPILCLVGPPGVGKTSLGKSIARATGRKFTRFSLGGMRDEAEIRGHRRTYIGAMPGRIVKALKDCGTVNPLIMLDEVDKLGTDFRGDPASALLEVLDPEQNDSFTDHYMDMPVNLSNVMFVTTANSLDTIPGPLRDRMEIIRLPGYIPSEKFEIARRYLVPREIENNGLSKSILKVRPAAIRRLISEYTMEAGVRGLQKQIASICRKVARQIAEEGSRQDKQRAAAPDASSNGTRARAKAKKKVKPPTKTFVIEPATVEELLGQPEIQPEAAERMGKPGVAIGLAWTPFGGEILFVEASRYPGKGDLRLTGQLGDVMKESATAAMTYLRSNSRTLGMDDKDFATYDYHVHVPAGATPKDGPSAGVSMTSAVASLVTGRPLKDYLAMTGEITLRGNVMPVGGIKEKCIAAYRAGIKEILIPKKNHRDLTEIPEDIRKTVKFHEVESIGEVLGLALKPPAKAKKRATTSA